MSQIGEFFKLWQRIDASGLTTDFLKVTRIANAMNLRKFKDLICSNVLMNIFTNYVLNKYNTFDDQDTRWMNDRIKKQNKNSLFKQYVKSGKTAHD